MKSNRSLDIIVFFVINFSVGKAKVVNELSIITLLTNSPLLIKAYVYVCQIYLNNFKWYKHTDYTLIEFLLRILSFFDTMWR